MAEITLEKLREMLVDILTPSASAPKEKTTAPNDAGSTLSDMVKKAANQFGEIATSGAAAVIGLSSVKEPALAWSKTVENLAQLTEKRFGEVGKVMGDTIRYIDYSRQLSVDAGKVGIGQGNGQAAQGKAMGAGFDDLKDQIGVIQKYGVAAQSYGRSADDANNKFLDFGKKLQEEDLTGKLKNLGLNTAREIANVAALAAAGKEEMLRTPEGRKKLAEETAVLAAEIHKTSQLSGVSREDIVAEMAARKQSAQSIHEDRAYRTDAERSSADSIRGATAGMGKSMQDITSRIAAGGYLNKTQRTELQVATGGRAGQYMAAVRDTRRTANLADNDPQKKAAKEKLDREITLANANVGSSRFARQAMVTQDPDRKAAMDKMAIENREAGRLRAVMAETGKGPLEAKEEMKRRAGANLEGRTQEGIDLPAGAPGTMNEGAKLSQTMQGLVENFRKNSAGMATALGELNTEMGKSPGLIKGLTTAGTAGGKLPENMTQDQATRNAKENLQTVVRPLGIYSGADADANRAAATTPNLEALRNRAKREHGTLGETGSPTESKDIVAKLHKGETVATPEQLKNLMSGSASNAISDLMKSATNKPIPAVTAPSGNNAINELMKSVTTKSTQPAPSGNIDISKITSGLKEITTTISSVSGGGSTTRSIVENDDAKAAKKELEAVKAQFQTEKNDIRAQVKSNLGADAKPADIMRAMRDNPQAKALEARMQEVTAKLSTRVSDGTTTKTVTEPSNKYTSQDKERFASANAPSASVTDGKMLADIQKNMAQGMSQVEAQKKAELAKVDKTSTVSISDIQKTLAQGMSQFNAQKKTEAQVQGKDNTEINRVKINDSTAPEINRAKINDIEPNFIESISNKLSTVKNDEPAAEPEEIEQSKEEPKLEEQSNKIGLNDLNEQLIQLNTSIRQLIQHSAESVETAGRQVKATKSLSGNRFA